MKKLTIGMATFDDYEGVYFTIQSLRLNNLDRFDEIDFLIIDNNPESEEGKTTKRFAASAGARYIPDTSWRSTAVRDRIFREALAPVAMSIDPHVLFEPGAVSRVIDYFDGNDSADLHHGVILYDYLETTGAVMTHMDPVWRADMFGIWGHDKKGADPTTPPYEIEQHGLGCFVCRVEAWEKSGGFHPLFRGFGGEEGYIHEKFRKAGATTILLPWLRWIHRFDRPRGSPYPLTIEERIRNYLIGWLDLDRDPEDVIKHFADTHPEVLVKEILLPEAWDLMNAYEHDPEKTVADWRAADDEVGRAVNWTDTTVNLGDPLEFDVKGFKLRVKKFGFEWATPGR